MATLLLPPILHYLAGNRHKLELPDTNLGAALEHLYTEYPQLGVNLRSDSGLIRSHFSLYRDGEMLTRADIILRKDDTIELTLAEKNTGADGQSELSREEIRQYIRHLTLPEFGMRSQMKLRNSKVLVIGAGGLGSPVLMYLAAAGVGTIGIVDEDSIDTSNLQRQVIYSHAMVGSSKLTSARRFIHDLNPGVCVISYETKFIAENALDIARGYDLIIDGTDNFPTRYLVNDVCVLLGIPNIYGSIFRFEGQASVFALPGGPCYRCLYPEPPPPGLVPSCAEGGVLGVLPGIIGSIQATEAIKILTGIGTSLSGRLLLFDALTMRFSEMQLKKKKDCPMCGESPSIHELVDYQEFCGIPGVWHPEALAPELEITPSELAEKLKRQHVTLIDVRQPQEWDICHIEGAQLIPGRTLPERLHEIDTSREVVLYCRSGVRSARALQVVHQAGLTHAKHLRGGILAWIAEIDNSMIAY